MKNLIAILVLGIALLFVSTACSNQKGAEGKKLGQELCDKMSKTTNPDDLQKIAMETMEKVKKLNDTLETKAFHEEISKCMSMKKQ